MPESSGRKCGLEGKREGERDSKQTHRKHTYSNVYIKGFPRSWTEENLVSHFSKFGKITSSFVPMNKEVEGECRGFAFLNFETNEVAVKAVEEMNGKEVFELDAEGKPKKSEGDKKEEGDAAKADKEAEDDASEASKESKGSTKSSKSKGGSKPDKFILYCGRAESREERQRKLRKYFLGSGEIKQEEG